MCGLFSPGFGFTALVWGNKKLSQVSASQAKGRGGLDPARRALKHPTLALHLLFYVFSMH